MSDKKLLELCKRYAAQALEARRKFAGLLPEVYRRRLYEKQNCSSVFEFAAKLAGMSREQVQKVLQLERKFDNKPALKRALVQGEVSAAKLARVASIATQENERELVVIAKTLSKHALETFVRDEKLNSLAPPLFDADSVPGHRIDLSEDVNRRFCELQGKGIDVDKMLLEFLERREEEIMRRKGALSTLARPTKSRYIIAEAKKVVEAEHGNKCSVPHCRKKAETLHHTSRFALTKTHDPKFLAPLCKGHHQIAHCIDEKYLRRRRG